MKAKALFNLLKNKHIWRLKYRIVPFLIQLQSQIKSRCPNQKNKIQDSDREKYCLIQKSGAIPEATHFWLRIKLESRES